MSNIWMHVRTTIAGLIGVLLPCHLAWAEPAQIAREPAGGTPTPEPARAPVGTGYLALLNLGVTGTVTEQTAVAASLGASGGANMSEERPDVVSGAARLMRITLDWRLGGGSAGFDGALLVDFGRGFRWPAQGHGVAIRGGARGQLQGNQNYLFSALHFPHVDVGYQYLAPNVVIEVSARGSMFWDGRFHVDESKSNLPQGAAWGTALDVGAYPGVFMAQLLQTGGLTQVDARFCIWASRIWIACARGDYLAEGWEAPGFERSVLVAGLSVGVFPFGY